MQPQSFCEKPHAPSEEGAVSLGLTEDGMRSILLEYKMQGMITVRKRALILAAVLCMALGVAVPAGAGKVDIEGFNHAVDTFCGVPAYYDEIATMSTTKWQCTEYVRRFYRDAYGLTINSIFSPFMISEGYDLKKTKTPKPGDIFHSPALRRGKTTDHTAIVKTVGDGYVTLIEQNHRYNGYASINRVVNIPDRAVDFYTPVGVGRPNPQLKWDQSPIRTKRAPLEEILEIGAAGIQNIQQIADPRATTARIVPSAEMTEPETTAQPASEAIVTMDAAMEEFVVKEMARAAAAQQPASTQIDQNVTAAELAAPGEAQSVEKISAPVLAVFCIALLAALGFGGVLLYKNEWIRRRIRLLLRK